MADSGGANGASRQPNSVLTSLDELRRIEDQRLNAEDQALRRAAEAEQQRIERECEAERERIERERAAEQQRIERRAAERRRLAAVEQQRLVEAERRARIEAELQLERQRIDLQRQIGAGRRSRRGLLAAGCGLVLLLAAGVTWHALRSNVERERAFAAELARMQARGDRTVEQSRQRFEQAQQRLQRLRQQVGALREDAAKEKEAAAAATVAAAAESAQRPKRPVRRPSASKQLQVRCDDGDPLCGIERAKPPGP